MSERSLVVSGGLQGHQVKKYLEAMGIDWHGWALSMTQDRIIFNATDEQWGQIQDWVKKVSA